MKYISTRGSAPVLDFDEVLLTGLASDGGLYLPESWPRFMAGDIRALRGLSYAETAFRVMAPFAGRAIGEAELQNLIAQAYGSFGHKAVAPLKQVDHRLWLMELFHGPTLAFKDVALQLVGRLFDHVLRRRGERVTVIGATSGDTGSAAIEACRDSDAVDIFMLHPHGRISEVQRRQMTTVLSANVHNIAIAGTFDDCQDLVKAMFADQGLRQQLRLSAVNSINWARVMAQIVYYVTAAVALGAPDRRLAFAVPTGNFGNVYAAYAAWQMGLPIDRLVIGTNRNDILHRFFASGKMSVGTVEPSLSPSMDIQVSSNFERLLFDLYDRDGARVARTQAGFRAEGSFALDASALARAKALFESTRVSDEETLATIARIRAETGEIIDPHTAVALEAAARSTLAPATPLVALATAHPAKFPDAVEAAIGLRPALPPRLADLGSRPERVTVLPNDLAAVSAYLRQHARLAA